MADPRSNKGISASAEQLGRMYGLSDDAILAAIGQGQQRMSYEAIPPRLTQYHPSLKAAGWGAAKDLTSAYMGLADWLYGPGFEGGWTTPEQAQARAVTEYVSRKAAPYIAEDPLAGAIGGGAAMMAASPLNVAAPLTLPAKAPLAARALGGAVMAGAEAAAEEGLIGGDAADAFQRGAGFSGAVNTLGALYGLRGGIPQMRASGKQPKPLIDREYYHGTHRFMGEDIDPRMAGTGEDIGRTREPVFWLTDDPEGVADTYLGKSYVRADAPGIEDYPGDYPEGVATIYGSGAQIQPYRLEGTEDDFDVWDWGGGSAIGSEAQIDSIIAEAKREGRAGVIFENMADPGISQMGRPKPSTIVAVLDPNRAKSRFATAADLPMDEASRMARARQMGFDPETTVYHGTHAPDIEEFDPGDVGTHVGTQAQAENRLSDVRANRLGIHFGGRAGHKYDEGANIMPLIVKRGKHLDMPDVGMWNDSSHVLSELEEIPEFRGRLDDLIAYVDEEKALFGRDQYDDWLQSRENREALDEINTMITDAGYDSIRYENKVEVDIGPRYTDAQRKRNTELYNEIQKLYAERAARKQPLPENPTESQLVEWLDQPEPEWLDDEWERFVALRDEQAALTKQAHQSPYSYIILNPENIRSKYAKFDPAKAKSANILAGAGGLGLLGAAAAKEKQSRKEER